MTAKTTILFIGATGYIGGSVLSRLLEHPDADTFAITALVRAEDKAKKFETFGVHVVIGSFKDASLVERLSEAAHIVFSCADCDDLPAMQAILKGLKQRHQNNGYVPILIHTSGTGVLTHGHNTKGMAIDNTIYDDSDFEQVAKIHPDAWHRSVDNAAFAADAEGYCRTFVIVPSTIYAFAKGPLVDAGIQNPNSIQIPMLVKASLARGQAGMVGKGLALWPNVHVDDMANFYIILFDAILSRGADNVDHGIKGYYYGENGEHSWYDISREIGRVMVGLGLSKSSEPTSFTTEELVKYWGSEELGNYWGSNSRARATHSRSLGWKPRYATEDMIASIKHEVEVVLDKQRTQ